jgi:pimeloyl-ACP methyl ester carboxylesterase
MPFQRVRTSGDKMATFVLVHGGWRGGWVWYRVAKQLRENGHTVYTPTLSGLAERSHLLNMGVNLTTHIQEIVNIIKCEELKDVVLCGHSYGGFVISGVADQIPECISSLVYFDAFVPQDGDSVFTLSSEAFQLYAIKTAAQLGGIACVTVPAASFALNEQDRAWFDEKTTPHPLASMLEGVRLKGDHLKVKKRMFIMAIWVTEFPSPFRQFYDRLKDDPAWVIHTIESGHDVMLNDPQAFVKFLQEAAG